MKPEETLSWPVFAFLREEIRHEDDLMNHRLSWLVSSQSFLLTGFAIAVDGPVASKFPEYTGINRALVILLPFAGLLAGLVTYLAILGGLLQMRKIRALAGTYHPEHLPQVQGTTLTRGLGLSAPALIPLIFLSVWGALILYRFGAQ